jgi:ribonucleotide monophosphatase NagD (HAD superfamily)
MKSLYVLSGWTQADEIKNEEMRQELQIYSVTEKKQYTENTG